MELNKGIHYRSGETRLKETSHILYKEKLNSEATQIQYILSLEEPKMIVEYKCRKDIEKRV